MAEDFNKLKKMRASEKIASLTERLESIDDSSKKTSFKDDRFWKPTLDKSGNGSAIIRFLPAAKGEDFPFVKKYSHYFRGPTGLWYIEDSLTTLKKNDPVSENNTLLWNTGLEKNKSLARERKRKLNYYSNILVVADPKAPENEGKVFLYRFGTKIMDKINDLMSPPDDELGGVEPIFPFCFWEGANFKLIIRQVDGYRNYDKSVFLSQSVIYDDDELIEEVWNKQYSLQELVDPKSFKSYDELKAKFDKVVGLNNVEVETEVSKSKVRDDVPVETKDDYPDETNDDAGSDITYQDDSFDELDSISALIDDI